MQCALSLLLLLSASSLRVCSAHGKLTKPTPRDGISVGRAGLDQNNPVSFEPGCSKENTCDAFVCREAAPNPNVPVTSVVAGQSMQLGWSFTALHVGDCSVYISYDVEKPRSQQKYVKIANIPDCKKYTTWNIEIPASLPAGKAILRWDWVALHIWPKTENFVQCADLDIKSTSATRPSELASFSITNPPIYPDDGNDGVGFRNAFGTGAQDMTGPSCIDDSINECRLTAPGTLRNTDSRRGSGASRPVPGPSPVPPTQAKPQPQPQPTSPQPVPEPVPQPTFAPQPAAGACVSNDPVIDYSVACKALEATCELYSFCKRVPVPPPKPQPQPQPTPTPVPAGSSPTPEAEAEEEEEEEEEAEAETPEAESEKEEEEEDEEAEAEKPEAESEAEEEEAEGEAEEETEEHASPSPPRTTSKPVTDCAALWGQCGGEGWAGHTCCAAGSSCRAHNQWYHQCEAETPEAGSEKEDEEEVEEEAEAEKPEAESEAEAEEEEAEGEAEEETEEHASPSPPRTTSKPVTDCAALWGQCGGEAWAGHTCCAAGSSCRAHNQWYHQCCPGGSLVSLAARSEESDRASHARKLRGRRAHRHHSMMLVEVARHSTKKGEVSDDDADDADGAIASDLPPPRAARDAEL